MQKIKNQENEFHAVEYMRKVRSELTEQFLSDRQKYLNDIRKTMEEFKMRQKKAYS